MPASHQQNFTLPGAVVPDELAALQPKLLELMQSKNKMALHAAQVTQLTTPYMQLLLACLKTPRPAQATTQILNASPSMRAAWADFGLNATHPLD